MMPLGNSSFTGCEFEPNDMMSQLPELVCSFPEPSCYLKIQMTVISSMVPHRISFNYAIVWCHYVIKQTDTYKTVKTTTTTSE